MDNDKNLSLYIHIPFCIRKCNYCDFLSFPCGQSCDYKSSKSSAKDDYIVSTDNAYTVSTDNEYMVSSDTACNVSTDNAYKVSIDIDYTVSSDNEKKHNKTEVDINDYISALCREISNIPLKYRNYEIYSIFIGGGTPSILSEAQISRVFDGLHKCFPSLIETAENQRIISARTDNKNTSLDTIENQKIIIEKIESTSPTIEITIEANPGTITKKKAECWKKLGINRISLGLQSADNEELSLLGRIHTWEDFLTSWDIITKAGFTNRNIDLISGIPGQTLEKYMASLEKVLALEPEHISAYSLQLEEGTRFFDKYSLDDLPSEEIDRQMYEMTGRILADAGYHRYEISNYSKPGYESKHNMVYWQRGNYLGLGLGAASMVDNTRFSNVRELDRYCDILDASEINQGVENTCSNHPDDVGAESSVKSFGAEFENKFSNCIDVFKSESSLKSFGSQFENIYSNCIDDFKSASSLKSFGANYENYHSLNEEEKMEEFMFLGLRLMRGVSEERFYRLFGKSMKEIYGDVLKKYLSSGHMKYENGFYSLTERGIDVSNVILADFLIL